ncbi:MAG: ABC transporter permease [Solobacterium sp.]|nr:ABC transporter permease [Solobacterium sp.]
MKNPLRKRHLRELRTDAGKYIVIFIILVMSISFVSGFLVADGSMIRAYDESFEKYNIEDGKFTAEHRLNRSQKREIEAWGVQLYDLFYHDADLTNGSTLRIFAERTEVDRVCLMEGDMPQSAGEIAVDRMYADNNSLKPGDAVSDGSHEWVISGLVALSDYSTMFSDNTDTMFDATTFGVAVVTADGFADIPGEPVRCYAWKYLQTPADEQQEHDLSEDFMAYLNDRIVLKNYLPRYANQAIVFTGDDMGSDRAMMEVLLYIIIVIVAFVFAVTMTNTITKEATVIGTLRASGFSRNELIRHYMTMPVIVTLISAVIGNILGYTVMKNLCAAMYYNSYSLPTYVTIWSPEAFLKTTIIPIIIMTVVNWLILYRSLSLRPLQFLRHDLSRRKKKRAVRLPHGLPFMQRFRIRIITQNLANYLTLFAGILFANILLLFGFGLPMILEDYQNSLSDNMLSNYQYILSIPSDISDEDHRLESLISGMKFLSDVETDNPDAEKFSAYNLMTVAEDDIRSEEIMLYGISPDSRYVHASFGPEDAYISQSLADKYDLEPGDVLRLKEKYKKDTYEVRITGVYSYEAALCVFMDRTRLNKMFDLGEETFAGYFSDTEITDIAEDHIGTQIDYQSLTKVSRQLDLSMGSMMDLVYAFAVVIFFVLMYLMTKTIIEKNAQSISMIKILGYSPGEISRLYIVVTFLAVIAFMLLSMPIVTRAIIFLYKYMILREMTGWIPIHLKPGLYVKMFVLGLLTYTLVAVLEYRRIRKVPMSEALKNVE